FAYTILYVEDVAATLDFYTRAFGLERKMLHDAGDYGELQTGATTLAFASRQMLRDMGKSPAVPGSPTFEIAFTTDDVVAAVEQALAAGAQLVDAPHQMPWGQTIAYVSDNSGFMVEICTPMG
ncbi:MAG: VOC family protein, partial [Cyanobacteria bacterium J06632_22]